MPSQAYLMVRSALAKQERVSNHAQRQCNAILAQPQRETHHFLPLDPPYGLTA